MHTKGPWTLGADLEGVITDWRDEHGNSAPENYARNGYVKTICKLTHSKFADIGEHVANGKLIAASPDLLVFAEYALKLMQNDIQWHGPCDHDAGICCCEQIGQMEKVSAVIANLKA